MKRYTLILLTLLSGSLLAQNLSFTGQIRPRFELRDGYKTLSTEDATAAMFTSQRTRFTALFGTEGVKAGISFQDVRVWGDVPQLNFSDVNGTSVHEAWAEVDLNKFLSLRAGRQEIAYDDQRIFGGVDWTQQGRSHDALVLKVKPCPKSQIHLGVAYNQDAEALFGKDYTVAGNYKAMQYLWLHRDMDAIGISLLYLHNGMAYQGPSDSTQEIVYSHTLGPRITYSREKLSAVASFYLQSGKDAANRDLNAMYFSIEGNYQLTGKFKAGLGFEFLSGRDQDAAAEENGAFTPLYGTNHKFNGWMDYFYVGNHINSVGLLDLYVPLSYTTGKWTFQAIPHLFQATARVLDPLDLQEELDAALGTELDLTAHYKISPMAGLSLGFSVMDGTETLQTLKGGDHEKISTWGWVMLDIKPFLKLEK